MIESLLYLTTGTVVINGSRVNKAGKRADAIFRLIRSALFSEDLMICSQSLYEYESS